MNTWKHGGPVLVDVNIGDDDSRFRIGITGNIRDFFVIQQKKRVPNPVFPDHMPRGNHNQGNRQLQVSGVVTVKINAGGIVFVDTANSAC